MDWGVNRALYQLLKEKLLEMFLFVILLSFKMAGTGNMSICLLFQWFMWLIDTHVSHMVSAIAGESLHRGRSNRACSSFTSSRKQWVFWQWKGTFSVHTRHLTCRLPGILLRQKVILEEIKKKCLFSKMDKGSLCLLLETMSKKTWVSSLSASQPFQLKCVK